jgi:hypothetical protein
MGATRNSTQDMEYKQNPWTAVGQIGGTMAGAWASSKQGG